ncbi:unnamed protein product [Rhizophagus irregularis]|nr:unnamed protein product [Rhizophagus irregularis]CAB4436551.1 unnamed protein product [Rhizophagus irregularis]
MIEMIEFSTTPRNSELKLSQGLLESAKKRLLGQNPPEEGVVLVKNVSFESYVKFCEAENNLPIKTRLINGNVVAYESALSSHGTAAGEVFGLMRVWSDQMTGTSKEDLIVAPNSYFTADFSIRPRNLPPPRAGLSCNSDGLPYPNMVIEVGYRESPRSLHGLAPFYLSPRTTIMIYLAIKIYPVRTHYPGRKPMVAMLYQRSSQTHNIPTRMISFGNAPLDNRVVNYFLGIGVNVTGVGIPGAPPCNTPNIPTYQLQIPAAEIFNRTPFILPTINFDLDLWEIQDRVLRP